uniref:Uncharacterized protein n=1 Tax=Anopheles coluzzii TaxID=1518534 RepID=A0A8W7PIX7_ANOCL
MQYFARLASLEGIRRLYLSSRPYDFVDEMKHIFIACKLFHLEEFTVRDRICFLHNFFMAEMVEFSECNERDRLLLLAVLDMQVVHKMKDAISIPLFLYVGSITLALLVRKCVYFSDETLSLEIFDRWNFNKLQMIPNFVETNLKNLDIDKTGATDAVSFNAAQIQITDEVNYTLLQRHFLLAVWVIFDKAIRAQLLSGHELQEASQYIEYLAEAKEKAGIIMGVQDDVPMFKHRMFAEYFAACWLRQNRDRVKQLSYFRSRSYWIKETFQIRDFFDRLVLEESPGLLVGVVGLCQVVVQASGHQHHAGGAGASLSGSFMQLDEVKALHPKHLQLLKRAVKAFEGTIDQSKLDPAGKEAVKRMALEQFMGRLAEKKRKAHGH